jgi:hypothetical protein
VQTARGQPLRQRKKADCLRKFLPSLETLSNNLTNNIASLGALTFDSDARRGLLIDVDSAMQTGVRTPRDADRKATIARKSNTEHRLQHYNFARYSVDPAPN